jgi:hypothetical protein
VRLDWFNDRSKHVERALPREERELMRDFGFGCRYFSPCEMLRPH